MKGPARRRPPLAFVIPSWKSTSRDGDSGSSERRAQIIGSNTGQKRVAIFPCDVQSRKRYRTPPPPHPCAFRGNVPL